MDVQVPKTCVVTFHHGTSQDAWDQISPQQNVKESLTIQVSMTVQEDRKHDFLLATQKHIIETVDNFSSLDGDKSNFPIRYTMQRI